MVYKEVDVLGDKMDSDNQKKTKSNNEIRTKLIDSSSSDKNKQLSEEIETKENYLDYIYKNYGYPMHKNNNNS